MEKSNKSLEHKSFKALVNKSMRYLQALQERFNDCYHGIKISDIGGFRDAPTLYIYWKMTDKNKTFYKTLTGLIETVLEESDNEDILVRMDLRDICRYELEMTEDIVDHDDANINIVDKDVPDEQCKTLEMIEKMDNDDENKYEELVKFIQEL